jgi:hypothetical protein
MPKLYHFSENPGIERFVPQAVPGRVNEEPVVWAVDADHAYIYYFPRECPRVTFYASANTSPEDVERFFGHSTARCVAAIESGWLDAMGTTRLYRYELADAGFDLQDEVAGYWVNRDDVTPLTVEPVGHLLAALAAQDVEVRIMPSLWPLYEAVVTSTLGFSVIRWRNAAPRPEAATDG